MFKDLSRVPAERRGKQLGRRVPVANLYGLRRYERINLGRGEAGRRCCED